jgi:hypothetical protein
LKCDGTRAEIRFRLSPKRTSPFKSAGASVESTAGSRSVCISVSNVGYTTFRGSVRVLATHSICQFPHHFSSRASPCAIRFHTHSTQYKATFTKYGFVRTASAVYNFYYLLLYTAEADRTIIAMAQIFSTTSQTMNNELQLTERGREKKSNIFFLLQAQRF